MVIRTITYDEPLIMTVALEAGGSSYGLDWSSRKRVQEHYPEAKGLPGVFFGYDRKDEFESLHGPLWALAATLVTGLTMEQIGELGGVRIYHPRTGKVYWEWRAEPARTE